MNLLNIDFRDGCLRITVTKAGSVKYSKIIKDFSLADEKSASETLASAIKDSGRGKGRANIVLPHKVVMNRTFQIPLMDISDAKKIIKREISKEFKEQKFVFGIRRLHKQKKVESGIQEILAEYALTADVLKYLNLLKTCGITPEIMTGSLEGNSHLFNRFRPETDGNEAVIDIGTNLIEFAVFNNGQLKDYERLSLSHIHDKKPENINMPAEQTDKIKIFGILDVLYKFIMASGKDSPEDKLSRLWFCGIGSTTEGLVSSMSEGLGINASLLVTPDMSIENASAFSALAGVSTISKAEQFINLIPEGIFDKRKRFIQKTILAASLSFYIILIAGGYTVLNRMEKDLKTTYEKVKSVQAAIPGADETADVYSSGQETLAKIASDNPSLYTVFRDIANLTPAGVILNDIKIEKSEGVTKLKLDATIKYSDENFKNAVLSKFMQSLDSSSRLKRVSSPEIAVSKTAEGQKYISLKTAYEIAR
ncbi:MAG: hypothetical protein A2Y81_05280 [Nitrospirae bacterium RBG_13_43_8]|nr:MAG: hypothetical protein A2Y81_05280 [Nitrospirae bacterium RBG_13_43_8]